VSRALLKAAYLYCFGNWGYDFVFSTAGNVVLNALNGELNYPINVPIAWWGNEIKEKGLGDFPLGSCLIQEPKEGCYPFGRTMLFSRLSLHYHSLFAKSL